MKKRKRLLQWYVLFFICTIIIFFVVPFKGTVGYIDKEQTYWPFNRFPEISLFILSSYRTWFIGQWIAFSGTLVFLEALCSMVEIRKNMIAKVILLVLFFMYFLPLLYFSAGSVLYLSPLPPMDFGTWLVWFGTRKNMLYIWWIISAVLLHLGIKL